MSDAVIISLIGTVGAVLAALISAFALRQSAANGRQAVQTHELVNSRMTELLSAATGRASAEGVIAGEQAQRDRASEAQP